MYNKLTYKYQVNEDGLTFNIELAGKSKEDVKIFKEDYSIAINVNDNKYKISYEDYLLKSKYDFDNVRAKMKNGLLTITVPQIKKIEKQIEIQ
jgi:HSP20 family molecular chaperone IbpA